MRPVRAAYTLLEVLLALAIASLVLVAVYAVVGYQLRQTQAGRDVIEQASLARAVLNRMHADVSSTIGLGEPARFRNQGDDTSDSSSSSSSSSSSTTSTTGTTSSSGSTTGGSGTPSTGASSSTSGTSTTSSSTNTSSPSSSSTTGQSTTQSAIQLPLGLIGSSDVLHLFVSKVPGEVYGGLASNGAPQLTSDLRRVTYWLGEGGAGLCRREVRLITSEEGTSTEVPGGSPLESLLAAEVKSVEFQYFDGSGWVSSWDSTQVGPDGSTPQGSPRAVKIRIGVQMSGKSAQGGEADLKYYTHTVFIPTAGGTPPATTSTTAEGASTAP
ncbi:MAG: type II secretion system protein GspJ [Gemmataceae bacterium]